MDCVYTLPEISFVGGEDQTIQLSFFTPKPLALPFDINGCRVDFSIINFSNKFGTVVLSKTGVPVFNEPTGTYSIAVVNLLPSETKNLYGKYIYQVTAIDPQGNTEIPNQGFMYITKNINPGFIS